MDLIYHHYRLVEPAPFLRDAGLTATLTGKHRDLGTEIDVVLALEEWERLEFELIASAFRAGRAFGEEVRYVELPRLPRHADCLLSSWGHTRGSP